MNKMPCSSSCSSCSSCGAGGFQSSTVNSSPSTYSTLNTYNRGMQGIQPVVPATTVSGFYVVPDLDPRLPYDTLSRGGSGGYGSIVSAYGAGAQNCCPKYKNVPCNAPMQFAPCAMRAPQQACNPDTSAPQLMAPVSTCGASSCGSSCGSAPSAGAMAYDYSGYSGY
jgi:hypothetical protein